MRNKLKQAKSRTRDTRCYRKCGWKAGQKTGRYVENLQKSSQISLVFTPTLKQQMRYLLFGETEQERFRTSDNRHIKGRGESFRLNQNESFLLPFFPELQRSALDCLIGDWKILCWRSIMAKEKRHVDAAIWDSWDNKWLSEATQQIN